MSKKNKLIDRLRSRPKNFTWEETTKLMGLCGFKVFNARGGGAGRMFIHERTRQKVRLHEPHPHNTLLPYMVDQLIEGLLAAGEIEE